MAIFPTGYSNKATPVGADKILIADSEASNQTKQVDIEDLPISTATSTAIGVVQTDIDTHEARTDNPHSVTKSQVGLSNVDNTSDLNKPISTGTQTALDGKMYNCDNQFAITDYTFTGSERSNSGYQVTTASNRTVNINPDLFSTGYEVKICKGTNNANTVTLDAGSGNNINGSQTYVLEYFNEIVTLIKDGDSTWKLLSSVPKTELARLNGGNSFSGNQIFDTDTLFVDSVNNRVGIGTASPSSRLHTQTIDSINRTTVESSSAGANLSTIILEADGPNNLSKVISQKGAGDTTARNLGFYTGTSERMRITTAGDLGIGVTNPGFSSGGGVGIFNATAPRLKLFNSASGSTANDGFDLTLVGNEAYIINRESGPLRFYTSASNEHLTVLSSGNVGISEVAPDYKLDVNGSLGITPGIGTTVTPVDNGDLTISTASNTSVVIRLKGSDGVVRSVTLTLA